MKREAYLVKREAYLVKREAYLVKREAYDEKIMREKIRNFRDLDVWKLGKEIVITVYGITKPFPKEEIYGLTSQMRRAAVSIPSNVAEGFNRYHNKEYKQLLYIALGSCEELETQIEVAFSLGFIRESCRNELVEKIDHESRMLRNLIKKL